MKKSKLKLKYEALLKERNELLDDIEVLVKEPTRSEKSNVLKLRYMMRFSMRDSIEKAFMQ